MALIGCPKCNGQISSRAIKCPHCGHNLINVEPDVQSINTPTSSEKNNVKPAPNTSLKYCIVGVAVIIILAILLLQPSTRRSAKYNSGGYSYSSTPKTANEKALDKAESYIQSLAFSHDGLVKQLEFEGFSASEAKYGADHCGADWNEQALKKANDYLQSNSFSYSGLLNQLIFEGFSDSQAKYGVDNCNANWEDQAYKKALSYMSFSDMTKTELVEQLEFEGFTYSEATYGANKAFR